MAVGLAMFVEVNVCVGFGMQMLRGRQEGVWG